MLRSSRYVTKLGQNRTALVAASSARSFNYQKEIYTRDVDAEPQNSRQVPSQVIESRASQANLYRYINAYHKYGFRLAQLDPLGLTNYAHVRAGTELDPAAYNLKTGEKFPVENLLFKPPASQLDLSQIEAYLKQNYSSHSAIEFDHLQSEEEKLWLAQEFESINATPIETSVKIEILKLLLKSQAFDLFLASKFPAYKRYSLEGGESSLVFYYSTFMHMANLGLQDLVIGIAHRGRLNLASIMLNLDPRLLFAKIKGKSEFSPEVTATGDIAHHYPCSTDLAYGSRRIHVSLLPNPSHLEAVDPLVLGKARSKQLYKKDCYYEEPPQSRSSKVATLMIHGDGAFAGQGIVPETFQLSRVPNYAVGGTVHLIVNNQLGFTLPSILGRSSQFNSDLAKAVDCPIVHVNGDHPEAAFRAAELAAKYRQRYGKDMVVDLICFRKYGHNELDDPTFTNPIMYKKIQSRVSVPNAYQSSSSNELSSDDKAAIERELKAFQAELNRALEDVNAGTFKIEPRNTYLQKQWESMRPSSNKERTYWPSGFNVPLLQQIGLKSVRYPEGFTIHPTIERAHVKRRIERINETVNNLSARTIDWSTAETLAIGSLLLQGFNVRISGQDVGRGTFSQRHGIFVDQMSARTHVPLNELEPDQPGQFEVCNSLLSEEAVLGYEYGFALDNPKNLVIWEAQFGDFFNGAQIILDTYISSGETKWMHQCGLVMLLPHGFDGAGPEHSSCRIERFLQSSSSLEDRPDSDDINYFVCHPTTPANFFHLLRRQMVMPFRKPLIVAAPKTLIRLPECVSSINEMNENTKFEAVLDDPRVKSKDAVKRVIFVFGKHYYALDEERTKRGADTVAIVRVEEISPFPASELRDVLKSYRNAREFVWAQEEHRNMGAWFFAAPRFERILGVRLDYAGRENRAAVVGIGALHAAEVKHILSKPFEK